MGAWVFFISFASVVHVCCCVETWWIPPRMCKLNKRWRFGRDTTEYYSVSDFDPPKTGNIYTERLEFSLRIVLVRWLDDSRAISRERMKVELE